MQDNPNTDNVIEHPAVDADDWEIALEPYGCFPTAALVLSVNFTVLRSHLDDPDNIQEAIEEIDRALDALYLHTHFHKLSYILFRRFADGTLSFEEQQILKSLGMSF